MNKPTLVVLAAGFGSRYGGLKQLDTFSEQGDTILDFSIYDAVKAGFKKVVFIIRKEIEKDFRELFETKLSQFIEVSFVFQEVDSIPAEYQGFGRKKPWGTGHAIMMSEKKVEGNFAVINADDFYGRQTFESLAKTLIKTDPNSSSFCMVGYLLKNTLSINGSVSRGECKVNDEGMLVGVTERTSIERINGTLMFEDSNKMQEIDEATTVSMNCYGFTTKYFEYSKPLFNEFIKENYEQPKAEFYFPLVVNENIKNGSSTVKVLNSASKWFGVTYKEDRTYVMSEIQKLKASGVYPENLWKTESVE
jgi:dTDP-glucose pyrophosphorylase